MQLHLNMLECEVLLSMMNQFKRLWKIDRWWNTQIPVMLAIIYFQLGQQKIAVPFSRLLFDIILYMVAALGIACFGQLLNDVCDREEDLLSRSPNLVVWKSRKKLLVMFVLVLLMAVLPWIMLPLTPAILILLIVEICLFIACSVPPLRFKRRGLLGPIVNGLCEYTVPFMVGLLTFGKLCGTELPLWFMTILAIWALLVGVHATLIRQLMLAQWDLLARRLTFVVQYGWQFTVEGMERYLLPAEMVAFILLVLAIGCYIPLVPIGFLVYLVWMLYRWKTFGIWQSGNPLQFPVVDRLFCCHLILLFRFYTDWLPFLLLIALVWHTPLYVILLVTHLLLFQSGIVTLVRIEIPEMRRLGRII